MPAKYSRVPSRPIYTVMQPTKFELVIDMKIAGASASLSADAARWWHL
jgi:hypothetical protein